MSNSHDSQTAEARVLQPPSFWSQENLVPIIMLSALATLAGATVAYYYQSSRASGDEPPIRVKSGSIEFHVLGNDKWKPRDNGAYWVMKNDKARQYDPIQITGAYNGATYNGQPCKTTAYGEAMYLDFLENDGSESQLTVKTVGKRTRVSAGTPGRLSGDDQKVLIYSGPGHIRRLSVESGGVKQIVCEFASATELVHLLLLDYQD